MCAIALRACVVACMHTECMSSSFDNEAQKANLNESKMTIKSGKEADGRTQGIPDVTR